MESFEKNYIELEKKKYPRVEKLSQNVFGYIDIQWVINSCPCEKIYCFLVK